VPYGHLTMAGGVRAAVDVLREVSTAGKTSTAFQRSDGDDGLETVRKLLASYELGRTSGDLNVCKDTFPDCGKETNAIKLAPVGGNVNGLNIFFIVSFILYL